MGSQAGSVAVQVAERLRQRILSGELQDQDLLPPQQSLLAEFGISRPSLREALTILETEGLLSVRRGSRGGAVVHSPHNGTIARGLSLVLDHRRVPLADVGIALQELEPVCAGMAAGREDRQHAVVEPLERIHAEFVAATDDLMRFTEVGRRFHQEIVAGCGNETLLVVVGALNALWADQERVWAEQASRSEQVPELEERRGGVHAHERIIELIRAGDSRGAHRTVRAHLLRSQRYALAASSRAHEDTVVQASGDREAWPHPDQ